MFRFFFFFYFLCAAVGTSAAPSNPAGDAVTSESSIERRAPMRYVLRTEYPSKNLPLFGVVDLQWETVLWDPDPHLATPVELVPAGIHFNSLVFLTGGHNKLYLNWNNETAQSGVLGSIVTAQPGITGLRLHNMSRELTWEGAQQKRDGWMICPIANKFRMFFLDAIFISPPPYCQGSPVFLDPFPENTT
ncbi:hypothetical protein GX51_06134 [Blastomyces parvus]|uniref:Uncharacterized protein n=1 Tax=Blastomyces parvus TaxID=2060905 RepID=A0A2B7WT33_9EURO|nr:hypothetical protein GX51_06134 [Blastomyces parvus]